MTKHRKIADQSFLIRRARQAIAWHKSDPHKGETFVTSSGRVGRITGERMCGRCPDGMVVAYDIEWLDDVRA